MVRQSLQLQCEVLVALVPVIVDGPDSHLNTRHVGVAIGDPVAPRLPTNCECSGEALIVDLALSCAIAGEHRDAEPFPGWRHVRDGPRDQPDFVCRPADALVYWHRRAAELEGHKPVADMNVGRRSGGVTDIVVLAVGHGCSDVAGHRARVSAECADGQRGGGVASGDGGCVAEPVERQDPPRHRHRDIQFVTRGELPGDGEHQVVDSLQHFHAIRRDGYLTRVLP